MGTGGIGSSAPFVTYSKWDEHCVGILSNLLLTITQRNRAGGAFNQWILERNTCIMEMCRNVWDKVIKGTLVCL